MNRVRFLLVASIVSLGACAEPPMQPMSGADATTSRSAHARGKGSNTAKSYVVIATDNALPGTLEAGIVAAGGSVVSRMDGIGVVTVTSSDANFARKAGQLSGVHAVVDDQPLEFAAPRFAAANSVRSSAKATAHAVGAHETYRLIQWAPDAVSAPAAWAQGALGQGARVAILDGGIYDIHADLAANFDAARSRSFVPGQPYDSDTGPFWHGTHVAGIVAASANDFGTIGIAPQATLIGVKVLHSGTGFFSWVIQGIYYAATPIAEGGAGAHIINMSLTARVSGRDPGLAFLLNALNRATSYANGRGAIVIAGAGNDAVDLDHTGNTVYIPAQSVGVLAISATGPLGFAHGATNFDRPASYTNFGQSAISFAGPGGDFVLPGNALCTYPVLPEGTESAFCWLLDMVIAPCRGTERPPNFAFCWSAGTSMAAPAVAGVAALIVGKYGPMHPSQLESRLRASADDLGKPGVDDFYGHGRVNAARAIQ